MKVYIGPYKSNGRTKTKIKIHKYDTWNMDGTLAIIIYPMLKQLKASQHGAPIVDDCDVPDELKSTAADPKEIDYDTDSNHFKRWDYVLGEMIWAFSQLQPDCDWGAAYFTDAKHPLESALDLNGYDAHSKRIKNGLTLFGKYYQNLWD